MRKRLVGIAVVGVLAIPAFTAGTGSADPLGICPDGMVMVTDNMVPNGTTKDKNQNGFVCAKMPPNGDTNGGPDDNLVVDDTII
jgi:hypothetical protein